MDHMCDDGNIGKMKPRANRSLKTNSAMTEQTILTRNVLKCTRTDKKFTKLFKRSGNNEIELHPRIVII